jgi:hypothetical protein
MERVLFYLMTFKVEVVSGRKGSNPGGRCRIPKINSLGECYIKYCPGSRVRREVDLNAYNAPFYELVANSLAISFRLNVPKTFVLLDYKKDVEFIGEKDFNGGRCYFVSKIDKREEEDVNSENAEEAAELLERDRLYFDLLGIEDVLTKPGSIGRRDNYLFFKRYGHSEIVYVDLGCCMGMRIKEGNLSLRDRTYKELRKADSIRKEVEKYHVIGRDGERIISLEKLLEDFGGLHLISLNPIACDSLDFHIPEREIDQLRDLLVLSMYNGINKNKDSDFLVKE